LTGGGASGMLADIGHFCDLANDQVEREGGSAILRFKSFCPFFYPRKRSRGCKMAREFVENIARVRGEE
jgi:hypothetical protein